MGQKTLFQILVKVVAVLAIAVAIPAILRMFGDLAMMTRLNAGWGTLRRAPPHVLLTWLIGVLVPHSAMLAVGLHLLLTDKLVERFAFPRPPEQCQCGSTCALGSECSDCGTINESELRMTPRTYFETVIRAVGLAICILALPHAFRLVGGILGTMFSRAPGFSPMPQWATPVMFGFHSVATVVEIAIGIYMLRGGQRIVTFLYPVDGLICARCGWNLERTTGDDCPECGAAIATNSAAITR